MSGDTWKWDGFHRRPEAEDTGAEMPRCHANVERVSQGLVGSKEEWYFKSGPIPRALQRQSDSTAIQSSGSVWDQTAWVWI